jgi:hypothetical protein
MTSSVFEHAKLYCILFLNNCMSFPKQYTSPLLTDSLLSNLILINIINKREIFKTFLLLEINPHRFPLYRTRFWRQATRFKASLRIPNVRFYISEANVWFSRKLIWKNLFRNPPQVSIFWFHIITNDTRAVFLRGKLWTYIRVIFSSNPGLHTGYSNLPILIPSWRMLG